MLHGLRRNLARIIVLGAVAGMAQAGDHLLTSWSQIQPICVECHNDTDWAAGLTFESLSIDSPARDAEVWEEALRRLRTGSMPPAGVRRPDAKAVRDLVDLIEARLDTAHGQSRRAQRPDAGANALSDSELASRLAALLWSGVPDEDLLNDARHGHLSDPARRDAQVRRMLADPKAASFFRNFGIRWLGLDRIEEVEPQARLLAGIAPATPDVRPLLVREMELFLDSVLRSDQPVTALLTADYTYLNDALASVYGVASVDGNRFRRVTLPDSRRHGLLGKGAVLLATAFPHRSSPSMRGSWILERVLGMKPYPRPPGIEPLVDGQAVDAASIRRRLAQHLESPSCFSCHGVMDPLGFALETFDPIGRVRGRDPRTGHPVDTTATLPDGTKLTGPDDLRGLLRAQSGQFVQTLTEQLMAYALGRELDWSDMPVVRQIVRNAARENYTFASIVSQVMGSDAFLSASNQRPAFPNPHSLVSTE